MHVEIFYVLGLGIGKTRRESSKKVVKLGENKLGEKAVKLGEKAVKL